MLRCLPLQVGTLNGQLTVLGDHNKTIQPVQRDQAFQTNAGSLAANGAFQHLACIGYKSVLFYFFFRWPALGKSYQRSH
jgi:hypothetical protein